MKTEATVRVSEEADETTDTIAQKKRVALAYLSEAWDGAIAEGVDSEILAHAALFTALCDLIATYGEEPVAELAKTLPRRIRELEFTIDERSIQ